LKPSHVHAASGYGQQVRTASQLKEAKMLDLLKRPRLLNQTVIKRFNSKPGSLPASAILRKRQVLDPL